MATKCPKCGGELVQITPEIAKCKKCGMAFKRKGTVETDSKAGNLNTPENKSKKGRGILKKAIIIIIALGILGSIFGDDEKKENESRNDSVWAEKETDLEEFEYYIDGDKIHINGYKGESKKIKVGDSYEVDGTNMKVESISDAPFIFGDLESIIVSEGIKKLEANVFNSCEAKYIFIPSTIKNVDDRFWGYFFEVEKLYYGGTQEQWNGICKVAREELDCKFIYCNVKVEELGEDDSGKDIVSMQEKEEKGEPKEVGESGIETNESKNYGLISDFKYDIQGGKVFLGSYDGDERIIELKKSYKIDGIKYKTDISKFNVSSSSVGVVIIGEGIKKINTSIFNGTSVTEVYFPKSIAKVYDYTLAYMNPRENEKIKVYYGGTKKEWDNIFTKYKRKKVKDAWKGKNPEEIGKALADKANEVIGVEYDGSEFEYSFSANPEELKQ